MDDSTLPPLDAPAAARWLQRVPEASPWLHEEVARRMQERLDWIKVQPQHWIHWQAVQGGMAAHRLLRQRYPRAACTVLENSAPALQRARQCFLGARWLPQNWLAPPTHVLDQVDQPAQMLWCNMALHASPDPLALMRRWLQALQVDGFLMFSCLGPDSLLELRALYQAQGWPAPAHAFTDMHDWGDMLLQAGFAEPVMDMEHITLSFDSPQRLLLELRGLGRNLHPGRFASLRGRRWHAALRQALTGAPLQLTFEVIYGHAFKPAPRVPLGQHASIPLEQMRQALKRPPPQGKA